MISHPSSRITYLLVRRGAPTGRNGIAAFSTTTITTTATSQSSSSSSAPSSLQRPFSTFHPVLFHDASGLSPSSSFAQDSSIQRRLTSGTAGYHSSAGRGDKTNRVADSHPASEEEENLPGSKAFLECDRAAVIDLFHKYAVYCDEEGDHLDKDGLRKILKAVGENPDEATLNRLYEAADLDGNGVIELSEFLHSSDMILGGAPAGIVLVVGGPGSGKGLLSKRLVKECGVVHLSSGELLREEVRRGTVLGNEVRDIMARGELVSSAVIVTLMRRRMRNHPGKRVLLDGFPRSLQNAADLVELCGKPELALHLECDDTVLLERILARSSSTEGGRDDDNVHTALKRLRTYHKYHHSTMEWLREQHVPVVNLDCSGSPENIWEQLTSIGRLMRPAVLLKKPEKPAVPSHGNDSRTAA